LEELEDNPTDEEKATYKEEKKDYKAQVILDQCVDAANFKKTGIYG
jgi:hypothetical protein